MTAHLIGLATFCVALSNAAVSAEVDPILAKNSTEAVRQSELEIELERVPPAMRDEFTASPARIGELLTQMLVRKALASQAKASKLDQEPANVSRLQAENQRVLAQLRIAQIDKRAIAEFDAKLEQHQARARELYLVDREKFRTPEEVNTSHILIDTRKRSSDEARKLAEAARARLVAGAEFKQVAREVSDDPAVATNGGALGWFTRDRVDPAFAAAAFALKQVGAISEPVLSQYGWHVIRLDGRRDSTVPPFDAVKEQIIGQLRARYVEEQREAVLGPVRNDPANAINTAALEQIFAKARAGREAAAKRPSPTPP